MFRNLKLSQRLYLGFGSLTLLTVGIGAYGAWTMNSAAKTAAVTAEAYIPAAELAEKLSATVGQMRQDGQLFMLTADASAWQRYADGRTKAGALLADAQKLGQSHDVLSFVQDPLARAEQLASACSTAMESSRVSHGIIDQAEAAMDASGPRINETLERLQKSQIEDVATADASSDFEGLARDVDYATQIRNGMGAARVSNFRARLFRDAAVLQPTEATFKSITENTTALAARLSDAKDRENLLALSDDFDAYRDALIAVRGELPKLNAAVETRGELVNQLTAVLSELTNTSMARVEEESEAAAAQLASGKTFLLAGAIGSGLLASILAFFITRSITKPVQRIAATLGAGADQTASANQQVSGSSQSLAQGASEQAASLEETSSALEEMASMTKKTADTAQQAAALATEAQQSANNGNHSMAKMSQAIDEIAKSAGETAKIIKVIDEIAFQTNLLALNAAVEAARAGEAGKGFAVVAEEVRNLAMRSAEAAKNTSALIEQSVQNAKNGVSMADTVAKSLAEIVEGNQKVNGLINEIAAASREQSAGIDQVNQAVSQMDKVTQTNAANAEESAAASEELSAQAEQLRQCVSELTALVGGGSNESSFAEAGPRLARPSRSAAPAKSSAKAKDLIPLEADADFKSAGDFSEFGRKAA